MNLAVFAVLLVLIPFQAEAAGCIGKNAKVIVTYGRGLTGDAHKSPDTYVVVKIGDATQKTQIIHGNANPGWDKELPFNDVDSNRMTITVFDADKGKRAKDDLLGTCTKKLVDNGTKHVKCDMDDKKGFVKLHYTCEKM